MTCASVNVTWDYTAKTVTLVATNLGRDLTGTIGTEDWFEVGLGGLQAGMAGTSVFSIWNGATYVASSRYETTLTSVPNGTMYTPEVYGVGAASPPPTNGLHVGEQGKWVFTFSDYNGMTSGTWETMLINAGVAIHAGSGPGNCSTKLYVTDIGVSPTGPYDPACSTTVVPEPGSMALLATGLIGLVGAGFVRRRKTA